MENQPELKEEENQEENGQYPPTLVSLKENLYDRIDVSLKTMNMVIAILVIVLIVFTTFGIWQANIK